MPIFSLRTDADASVNWKNDSYQVILIIYARWKFQNATEGFISLFPFFFPTTFHLRFPADTDIMRLKCEDRGGWSVNQRSNYTGTFLDWCQVLWVCVTTLNKRRKLNNNILDM